jgi:hypothetical protein
MKDRLGEIINMSEQIKADLVTECLTQRCQDCYGSYINKLTGYKLNCICQCHNKKMLEQQVVQPACSNTSQNQSVQQHGVPLHD